MKTRTLGRTKLEVSVIGFGGIPIQGISHDKAEAVLLKALDSGINFFDTARAYTDSEEKIGRALSERRNEFFLATKSLCRDGQGMAGDIEASLGNMRTDRIDLYQLHGLASKEQLEQAMGPGGAVEALARARAQGKVRFIGVTGHIRSVLNAAVETGLFDTVQLPFNPFETESVNDVIPAAKAANAGLIGMKPAAGGAIADVPAALRFTLSHGIDIVIPGMDCVEQVVVNTAVGEALRALTEKEIAALNAEKELWGDRFCRRCAYCMPCPNGLQIPFLFLIEAYYTRYGLQKWALERLSNLEKKYADCSECGECMDKCPYKLPIPQMMAKAKDQVI